MTTDLKELSDILRNRNITQKHANFFIYVGKYCALFLETKNPLYAWKAFENAQRFNYPIPDEILDYILDTAHSIVKIAQNPPEPAKRPVAIAKALRLHKKGAGQGSVFHDFSTRLHDRKIALDTSEKVKYYGNSKSDYAFDDIAEKHSISKSTARRNFLEHKKQWRAMTKKLIESKAIQKEPDGRWRLELNVCGTADDLREYAEILDELKNIETSS